MGDSDERLGVFLASGFDSGNETRKAKTVSESKHTPGPWKADTFLVTASNGREVTHVGLLGRRKSSFPDQSGVDECVANARLIAAAPDLLAALKQAVQLGIVANDWNLDEVEIDGEMVDIWDLINRFKEVIDQVKAGAQ